MLLSVKQAIFAVYVAVCVKFAIGSSLLTKPQELRTAPLKDVIFALQSPTGFHQFVYEMQQKLQRYDIISQPKAIQLLKTEAEALLPPSSSSVPAARTALNSNVLMCIRNRFNANISLEKANEIFSFICISLVDRRSIVWQTNAPKSKELISASPFWLLWAFLFEEKFAKHAKTLLKGYASYDLFVIAAAAPSTLSATPNAQIAEILANILRDLNLAQHQHNLYTSYIVFRTFCTLSCNLTIHQFATEQLWRIEWRKTYKLYRKKYRIAKECDLLRYGDTNSKHSIKQKPSHVLAPELTVWRLMENFVLNCNVEALVKYFGKKRSLFWPRKQPVNMFESEVCAKWPELCNLQNQV